MVRQVSSKRFRSKLLTFGALAIFISAMCIGVVLSQAKELYEVTFDGKLIGAVSNPQIVQQWLDKQKDQFKRQYPGADFHTNEEVIAFQPVKAWKNRQDDQTVIDGLKNKFIISAIGTEVVIDGSFLRCAFSECRAA